MSIKTRTRPRSTSSERSVSRVENISPRSSGTTASRATIRGRILSRDRNEHKPQFRDFKSITTAALKPGQNGPSSPQQRRVFSLTFPDLWVAAHWR